VDGSIIVCQRRGLNQFNEFTLLSTHELGSTAGETLHPWRGVTSEALYAEPAYHDVLRWMTELNVTLWRSDITRLSTERDDP